MRTNDVQKMMVGRSVGKLVKHVATRFPEKAVCIGKTILSWCSIEISEIDYFSRHPRWNWTARSERSFGSGIETGGGELADPMNLFSMIGVGIVKQSYTSQDKRLLELFEPNSKSTE